MLPADLEPIPAGTCAGPIYGPDAGFGYHGQCCEIMVCDTPVNGACLPASSAHPPGLPPGSGSCMCSELPLRGRTVRLAPRVDALPPLPGHGFLSDDEARAAREHAIASVILPAARALLGSASLAECRRELHELGVS